MLPKYLIGAYGRYKSDTARFTTWLETTAKSCGAPPSLGKDCGKNIEDDKLKNRIPLSQFIPLAKQISTSKPNIEVPRSIVVLIRRAIALRKKCAAWFRENAKSQTATNKGHSYFISVLEQVLEILGVGKDVIESDNARKVTFDGEPTTDKGDLNNLFTLLDLEDTTEDLDEPLKTKQSSGADGESYDLYVDETVDDEEQALEEGMFSLYCLLLDLQNVRDFISKIWSEYKSNKVDVMSTAVTTNTAIDLARRACAEYLEHNASFINSLAQQLPGKSIPSVIYFAYCSDIGVNPTKQQRQGDPYNFAVAAMAEASYLNTDILLRSFCDVLKSSREIPVFKEGYFGIYDAKLDRSKMNAHQRFNEDKIIILQSMTNFAFLERFRIPVPGEDEITKGLKQMVKTKEIPLWLAFATQIYLDIHHILRDDVQKGWQDARLHAARTKKTLKDYFLLKQDLSDNPFWAKGNDQIFTAVGEDIERFIEHDIFITGASKKPPGQRDDHWFQFLKWHPLQAGSLTFNINLRMQEAGVVLVNTWGTVIYLAYLYNAVLQSNSVNFVWPDMDILLRFHGDDRIFFGGRPKTVDESLKYCALIAGVSSQAIAAAKSGRKVPFSKFASVKGPRGLEESTTIAQIFRERYCREREHSADLSLANVEQVLNDIVERGSMNRKPESQLLRRRWEKSHKFSPLQLLVALRERLIEEEPMLIFNYFGMHRVGLALLRTLHSEFKDKFIQYWGSNYGIEHDYQLPGVVPLIFRVASGSAQAAKQMGLDKGMGSGGVMSKIIMRAGNLMKEYLEKNGSNFHRELKVFCKNKKDLLPENEAPQRESPLYWFSLDEVIDPKALVAMSLGMR